MNQESMAVQVSTGALKRLFDETPEVWVKLQSMACEKIAQELVRKVLDKHAADIQRAIGRHLPTQWKSGDLDKKAVELIRNCIAAEIKAMKDDATGGLAQAIETAVVNKLVLRLDQHATLHMSKLEDWWAQRLAETRLMTRQLARDEFLAVLAEAKAAMS